MKLHLGCGNNYIAGWVNIDISGKVDMYADLRKPLPFPDQSVDFIFTEAVMEHFNYLDGLKLLIECHRVLKPEGVIRVSTPDLDFLIECYEQGRIKEFADVGWISESPCKFINEGLRLWGHQFVYDHDELVSSFNKAGFSKVSFTKWRESNYKELQNLESRPYHRELLVEAIK